MRKPDFLAVLPLAIIAWRGRPVPAGLGQGDCAQFTADVAAQIGVDVALPGAWATPLGAARLHRKVGGIGGHLAGVLPEIPAHTALCGDIVVLDQGQEGLGNCGVLCAARFWTVMIDEGLISLDWGRVQAEHPGARTFSTAPQMEPAGA
jgi:hypothetical protein